MAGDRASRIAKVKALLAMTVENGCTEAEAMSALEKARAIMDADGIDELDLAFGGEKVEANAQCVSDRDRIRDRLFVSVGRFCGCRSWTGGFESVVFCGLVSETIFAHWLLDMLADFVDRELANYLARTPGVGRVRRKETEAFTEGCCARICERLDELAPKRSDLALARASLIETFLAEQDIRLSRGRSRFKLLEADAHDAGEAAGDGAQFARPVDTGAIKALR
jgi:hypothetical protein